MKSPFPGMDPYIEACDEWGDFHEKLVGEIERALAPRLPTGFFSRLGKRSYIALVEDEEKKERFFQPDVKILAPRQIAPSAAGSSAQASSATAEVEPIELIATLEDSFEETFLDIFESYPESRLVTSIEVLSPSNKRPGSEAWGQYLRKRQALLLGKANLVEIDLLRGGTRFPMRGKWPTSPYTLLVARQELAPRCHVWSAYFDRALPTIPVPLAKPHANLSLDLQPLVEAIYERSRYGARFDYSKPLDPPLTSEEVAWLQERLRARETPSKPARRRKSKR